MGVGGIFKPKGGGGTAKKIKVTHFLHTKFISPVHKTVYIFTIA